MGEKTKPNTIMEMKCMQKKISESQTATLRIGACVSMAQSALFEVIALSAMILGIDNFVTRGFGSLFQQNNALFLVLCFAFVVIAILGIAITPAEQEVMKIHHKGLVTLGSNFAYLGHAGTILYFSWWIFFVIAHSTEQATITMMTEFLPIAWGVMFELFFVGAWVWIIAYIIFRYHALTTRFGIISIIKATSFWLTLVAFSLNDRFLCNLGLTLTAVIFGPLWHAWIAVIFFRRMNKKGVQS